MSNKQERLVILGLIHASLMKYKLMMQEIFLENWKKTIADRKIHPVEKSYTNYLLNEGVDKICKKSG